jgi:hypothetical protein
MKTPIQLWNEYRTDVYGLEPLQPTQEATLRHAFIGALQTALDVLGHEPDKKTMEWFSAHIEQLKTLSPKEAKTLDIDEMVQQFRTLRISQIRQQLTHDDKHNIDRLICVYHFLKLAKERMG